MTASRSATLRFYGFLAGKGAVIGDAVSPAISSGEWGELK
jgi:hypothetical protein